MAKKEKITLKKLQEEIIGTSEDIWLAGLGVYSTVEAEGEKLFDKFVEKGKELIEKGKEVEESGKKKAKKAKADSGSKLDDAVKFVEGKVKGLGNTIIEPLGISSREEVKELNEKVDKLTEIVMVLAQKIDDLNKPAKPAKPATTRKSTAKSA